jgi:hypothetical protein
MSELIFQRKGMSKGANPSGLVAQTMFQVTFSRDEARDVAT